MLRFGIFEGQRQGGRGNRREKRAGKGHAGAAAYHYEVLMKVRIGKGMKQHICTNMAPLLYNAASCPQLEDVISFLNNIYNTKCECKFCLH